VDECKSPWHMATLNARLRLTREHYAGTTTHNRVHPAFNPGTGFGLGIGGRYGFGATPPWERVGAESVYDPVAFAEYFAWRPAGAYTRPLFSST